jgi:hypothetical protein
VKRRCARRTLDVARGLALAVSAWACAGQDEPASEMNPQRQADPAPPDSAAAVRADTGMSRETAEERGDQPLPLATPEPEPEMPGMPGDTPRIRAVGRQLLVAGEPLLLRGVCWNPVPVGARHPEGLDFAGFAERDVAQMRELGVNVVRTYEPLLDQGVLDRLAAAGISVINSVYPWGGADASVVVERVRSVRSHPAILMWAVGNEWNYNGLYVGLSHADALARLNEVVRLIKAEDSEHPVATIYGELPDAETLAGMPGVDVWGINAYRGISFGELFERWGELSNLPMFISEYGADAYNANLPGYDPESQAQAVAALTQEIFANASSGAPAGVSLGGTLFEWADEWWKDQAGSLSEQDVGGIAPGGGPFPDQVFNEEWWGIVDVQRQARPAWGALQLVFREAQARAPGD